MNGVCLQLGEFNISFYLGYWEDGSLTHAHRMLRVRTKFLSAWQWSAGELRAVSGWDIMVKSSEVCVLVRRKKR